MSIAHLSGPLALGAGSLEPITTATVLSYNDDGKTILFKGLNGVVITLPPQKAGLRFKFMTGSTFAASDYVINTDPTDTNTIEGSILVAGAPVSASTSSTITFVSTLEIVGDYIELISDGSLWYISGVALLSGAVTIA